MAINELVYRNHTFSRIRNAKARFSESVSLSTLPVDTLTVTVVEGDASIPAPSPFLPLFTSQLLSSEDKLITAPQPIDRPTVGPYSGSLDEYSYGEVVTYYHAGSRICKFYLESIKQVGKWDWTFNCISPVGMLITSDHYGGIYTGQKAGVVIADIIHGIVPYTIDSKLAEVEVFGWLPKASRRNNLRDVLFACNAVVEYNSNGDLHFYQYNKQPSPHPLTARSFYLGGSVNNGTPATEAIVVEHNFVARTSDETVTLYDGEASATQIVTPGGQTVNGVLVEFKEPMHNLQISGASILESNPNYAVISSTGYANLTGQKYTHTQRQVSKTSEVTSSPNVVQSSKCTLINIRNSKIASERTIAFYGYAYKVSVDLLYNNQRCGEYISFTDPYGHSRVGYIETLNLVFSKEIKASATVICGFIPPYEIPMYLHSQTFTANTTWTVPEGVTSVRVVCIGGGYGGTSGHNGKANNPSTGTTNSWSGHQTSGGGNTYNNPGREMGPTLGGDGGEPGSPGAGGKVYSTTIPVTPGQQFAVIIGTGGAGGVGDFVAGSAGTPTTFGSLSSNSGASAPTGYVEELTRVTYGAPGGTGIKGQHGVDGSSERAYNSFWGDYSQLNKTFTVPPPLVYNGVSYVAGQAQKEESAFYNESGSPNSSSGKRMWQGNRGLGGGAAVGTNGPSSGTTSRLGATGAKPIKPPAATHPGNGGNAGHGGGGAGGAGGMATGVRINSSYGSGSPPTVAVAEATQGGSGGDGGNGAPGICFIYYYSPEEV